MATAEYPTQLPILPIVSDNTQYPKSEDLNKLYREIEAIATAMGISPTTIDEGVPPAATPTSIANFMDMAEYIIKARNNQSTDIIQANVTSRRLIGGGGAGGQIAAGATQYVGIGRLALSSTESDVRFLVSSKLQLQAAIVYVGVAAAQPASGAMTLTVRHNGTDTAATISVTAGGSGRFAGGTGYSNIWYPGDLLSVKAANAAASNSADINGLMLFFRRS